MTIRAIFYTIAGYLAGSILFAPLAASLLGKGNIAEDSADKNPGTTNAFRNGGFFCGLLTLIGDMAKGYLPVYLYLRETVPEGLGLALVLAAPVVGHIFPVFADFRGGKGIATTFGCLLGLGGLWEPAAILTGVFLLFSTIIRVTPHYHRTICTYLAALAGMVLAHQCGGVILGFFLITGAVLHRLSTSIEEKEAMKVRILWTH